MQARRLIQEQVATGLGLVSSSGRPGPGLMYIRACLALFVPVAVTLIRQLCLTVREGHVGRALLGGTTMTKNETAIALLVLMVSCGTAFGQGAKEESRPAFSQVEGNLVGNVESVIVPAAEAMPAEKYDFAPTNGEFKGVRTFAQQLKHLASANYEMGSAILGEKPPVETGGENGPERVEGKNAVVAYVKASFSYLHKAFASINEKNATELIQSPIEPGTVTKIGLATLCLWHDFDHYGQMVEYLRTNGIVPPASQR